MSTPPSASSAWATTSAACSASLTSAVKVSQCARGRDLRSAPAVFASAFASASTSMTPAPSLQKTCAVAAPMPAAPPVMIATLPSRRFTPASIGFRAGLADHLAPARDLAANPLAELLGAAGHEIHLHLLELGADLGRVQDPDDLLVVALDDRARRAARREEADPRLRDEIRIALLDHRGDLGRRGEALLSRRGDEARTSILGELEDVARDEERGGHLPA